MRNLSWLLPVAILVLAVWTGARAQDTATDPLADPIVRGAWLYEGNCVRCHGAYAKARLGEEKSRKTVTAEISGDARQGCTIDWGIAHGGALSIKEINAIVDFIEAWEEQGGDLTLPPLPPQPTPTLTPTPTVAPSSDEVALAVPVTPTPTPLPPDLLLALDSNPIARGAWLYTQNCYRCHREYASGRMGIGLERDRIERTIRGGKSGTNMPAFAISQGGTLQANDIKLIVNYIEAFERLGVEPALPDVVRRSMAQTLDPALLAPIALPTTPIVEGNATRGALLYRVYCIDCHGVQGEGGVGPTLPGVWLGVRPDLTLRAVIARGAPGTQMRGWSQAHGGPLDDAAIDDVVAYLLTLPPDILLAQENPHPPPTLVPSLWYDWPGAALLMIVVSGIGGAIWRQQRRRYR